MFRHPDSTTVPNPAPVRSAARLAGILLLIAGLTGTSGCMLRDFTLKPYRINIQQGNYLEEEDVDQVQPGMTRSQVRFLLGTPMVEDLFNGDRWDYIYYLKIGRSREVFTRHFIVYFEGDQAVRVEKDLGNTQDNPYGEIEKAGSDSA
jgi:outer membrane protein assembly factor BamE